MDKFIKKKYSKDDRNNMSMGFQMKNRNFWPLMLACRMVG